MESRGLLALIPNTRLFDDLVQRARTDPRRIMIQSLRLPLQPIERHSNRLLNRYIRRSTELGYLVVRSTTARVRLPQCRCLHDSGDKSYTVSDLHGVGLAR